jgi:hypothetical protein
MAAVAGLVATTPASAASVAPTVMAWWNVQNQGVVPPPAPPGVNPGDLFVEGAGGNQPAAAPAPFPSGVGSQGAADAISGLTFNIGSGAKVEKLTLHFDGMAPVQSSVEACRATAPFGAQENGPWADVPPYDCTTTAVGKVAPDGQTIVFADIGALVKNGGLSVVLVPQFYDRQVWTKPAADALTFSPPAPKFDMAQQPLPAFDTASGFGSGATTGALPAPAPAFNPPAPASTSPPRPPVANGATRPILAAPGAAVDPNRARIVAALALVTSLSLFAFMMSVNTTLWRRLFGARAAAMVARQAGSARGVGRFKSVRAGRPDSV